MQDSKECRSWFDRFGFEAKVDKMIGERHHRDGNDISCNGIHLLSFGIIIEENEDYCVWHAQFFETRKIQADDI